MSRPFWPFLPVAIEFDFCALRQKAESPSAGVGEFFEGFTADHATVLGEFVRLQWRTGNDRFVAGNRLAVALKEDAMKAIAPANK